MSSISLSNFGLGGLPLSRAFSHSLDGSRSSFMREIRAGGISRSDSRRSTLGSDTFVSKKETRCPEAYSSSPSSNHQSIRSCVGIEGYRRETADTTISPRISTHSGFALISTVSRDKSTCPYRRRSSAFGSSPYVFHCIRMLIVSSFKTKKGHTICSPAFMAFVDTILSSSSS